MCSDWIELWARLARLQEMTEQQEQALADFQPAIRERMAHTDAKCREVEELFAQIRNQARPQEDSP